MSVPEIPKFIGRYPIEGILGKGSMGVVYRGRDPEILRPVAIKTLFKVVLSKEGNQDTLFEKIRREARLAGNLRNPHIVRIYEVGRDGDVPYIVMDLVESTGLDAIIPKGQGIDTRRALPIFEQIGTSIDYAHKQGILHRDIKPANILISADDFVSIVDFGVAAVAHASVETSPGKKETPIVGSPGYMSPEQIRNESLDHRTDLFSFAVVAYETLFGARPFPGKTAIEVIANILHKPPVSVRIHRPEYPESIDTFFAKALAKDKIARFSSGAEFVTALRVAFAGIPHGRAVRGFGVGRSSSIQRGVQNDRHTALMKRTFATVRAQNRFHFSAVLFAICTAAVGIVLISTAITINQPLPTKTIEEQLLPDPGTPASALSNPRLVILLRRGDLSEPRTRECLDELFKRRLPEVGPILAEKLLDVRTQIRIQVIRLLGALGDNRFAPTLILHLEDRDPLIREEVARTLGLLGDPRALQPLVTRFSNEKFSDIRRVLKESIERIEKIPPSRKP